MKQMPFAYHLPIIVNVIEKIFGTFSHAVVFSGNSGTAVDVLILWNSPTNHRLILLLIPTHPMFVPNLRALVIECFGSPCDAMFPTFWHSVLTLFKATFELF